MSSNNLVYFQSTVFIACECSIINPKKKSKNTIEMKEKVIKKITIKRAVIKLVEIGRMYAISLSLISFSLAKKEAIKKANN